MRLIQILLLLANNVQIKKIMEGGGRWQLKSLRRCSLDNWAQCDTVLHFNIDTDRHLMVVRILLWGCAPFSYLQEGEPVLIYYLVHEIYMLLSFKEKGPPQSCLQRLLRKKPIISFINFLSISCHLCTGDAPDLSCCSQCLVNKSYCSFGKNQDGV